MYGTDEMYDSVFEHCYTAFLQLRRVLDGMLEGNDGPGGGAEPSAESSCSHLDGRAVAE